MSSVIGDLLIVMAAGVLAVLCGSPLTRAVFRRVDRRATDQGPGRPTILAAAAVLRGGAWIGALERLAVYAGLMTGWRESIAVILAIKGLARYPELRATTSAAAERFIIGTFVSVLFACGCAGLALWLTALTP